MDKFDREKFEEELAEMGIEYNPSALKFPWWTRMLMRFSPNLGIKTLHKHLGIDSDVYEKAHNVFSNIQRIDIFPLCGNHRGFILTLDEKTALFFYQNGDHFKYDGWETGNYAKGDVTIFDQIKDDLFGPYDL